ncbi:hypothetical protein V8F20_012209 [Naviculisporaceae sp. PSN 640]
MSSSFSRHRTVRDLQEALDPDYPKDFTKEKFLSFVRHRGYRSFWEVGNRLRVDLIYWMATHSEVFMPWLSDVEKLRPGYFDPLPPDRMSRYRREYDLLVRLNLLPPLDPAFLHHHSRNPHANPVTKLEEICHQSLKQSQVLLDALLTQQTIIETLKAQPTFPPGESAAESNKFKALHNPFQGYLNDPPDQSPRVAQRLAKKTPADRMPLVEETDPPGTGTDYEDDSLLTLSGFDALDRVAIQAQSHTKPAASRNQRQIVQASSSPAGSRRAGVHNNTESSRHRRRQPQGYESSNLQAQSQTEIEVRDSSDSDSFVPDSYGESESEEGSEASGLSDDLAISDPMVI